MGHSSNDQNLPNKGNFCCLGRGEEKYLNKLEGEGRNVA